MILGLLRIFAQTFKHDGNAPLVFFQRALRIGGAAFRQSLDQPDGAGAEFVVGGLDIGHQIIGDSPEPHHGDGAEHVDDEFRGGAGLEAGRAGDEFRADGEIDFDIDRDADRATRIAGKKNRTRTFTARFFQSREDKRCLAAGRDAADDVFFRESARAQLGDCGFADVLGAFQALINRFQSAGDDGLDLLGWGVEGRRHFAGVEDAEPAAGARAYIYKAPARAEFSRDELRRAADGTTLSEKRALDVAFLADEEIDQLRDRAAIETARTRITLFGSRRGKSGQTRRFGNRPTGNMLRFDVRRADFSSWIAAAPATRDAPRTPGVVHKNDFEPGNFLRKAR